MEADANIARIRELGAARVYDLAFQRWERTHVAFTARLDMFDADARTVLYSHVTRHIKSTFGAVRGLQIFEQKPETLPSNEF